MFCVLSSSCGSVLAKSSAAVTIREICDSVNEGLREVTFDDADDDDEIVGGVPKVVELEPQKVCDIV